MFVNKYNYISGYGEIFSIILNNSGFILLICNDLLDEYYKTIQSKISSTTYRVFQSELDMIWNSVNYQPNGPNSIPKIKDKADQKFVNCANQENKPTIIITTNIEDFQDKQSNPKNYKKDIEYIEFDNNIVILPEVWFDEKARNRIIEGLKDTERRKKNMRSKK